MVDCPERDRLLNMRERAYRRYAGARGVLRSKERTALPDEFRVLQIAVSDARLDLDVADLSVELHIRKHHCRI